MKHFFNGGFANLENVIKIIFTEMNTLIFGLGNSM